MKQLQTLIALLVLLLATGCQKSIGDDDASPGATPPGISDDQKAGALTVKQAFQQATGTVCIKAFVVAATTRSMSNAEFQEPFSATQAILLAQRQSDGTDTQFGNVELMPVCLTDCSKAISSALNLHDNPDLWNKYVYIVGTLDKYLGQIGLKNVKAIEVDHSHVVTEDEKPSKSDEGGGSDDPDDPDNPDNPDNPDDPDNPDSPDNPDNPDDPDDPDATILSVAEAIAAPEQSNMTVKGYIVAALTGDTEHISFSYPGFSGYKTAIVLADQKYTYESTFDTKDYKDLFIVYLGDSKPAKLKNELNLVDHPENHNRQIVITGKKGFYYGTKLLLQVTSYQWATP